MADYLIQAYGMSFLSYVLAVEGDSLDENGLTDEQRSVLSLLRELLAEAPEDREGFALHSQLARLGQWVSDAQTSLANALRLEAGGELPSLPEGDDPLTANLQILARDVWPTLLLPPPKQAPAPFWNSIPLGVFGHPAASSAGHEFLQDGSLGRLFPGVAVEEDFSEDTLLNAKAWWINSSGRGGTHQLISLLSTTITNARLYALVRTGDESWEAFVQAIPEVIRDLRALADGKTANVPRLVGFQGIAIPSNLQIDLSVGTLLAPRPRDQDFLLSGPDQATAVLVTHFPLRLGDVKPHDPDPHSISDRFESSWELLKEDSEVVRQEGDRVRLATLLASPPDQIWGLSEVSSITIDPTAPGGIPQWRPRGVGTGQSAELDSTGAHRIPFWFGEIQEKHPPELDIAMRRVLSAASDRIDPIDAFIDAVIAWENCFGTSTETTFRVTAAIAVLLEPDSLEARLRKNAELKKIYGKRSRIVHGATQIGPDEGNVLRDKALQVAIDCLRTLYQERVDLLPLKSEDRSTRLLLGTDGLRQIDATT